MESMEMYSSLHFLVITVGVVSYLTFFFLSTPHFNAGRGNYSNSFLG